MCFTRQFSAQEEAEGPKVELQEHKKDQGKKAWESAFSTG